MVTSITYLVTVRSVR